MVVFLTDIFFIIQLLCWLSIGVVIAADKIESIIRRRGCKYGMGNRNNWRDRRGCGNNCRPRRRKQKDKRTSSHTAKRMVKKDNRGSDTRQIQDNQ